MKLMSEAQKMVVDQDAAARFVSHHTKQSKKRKEDK
jgi:hypothetical protein